ncbi:Crp/Fnr family transcriptional regulator [Allorhizobium sp. BGMRC 0089]|uniref:Crp/Fnr family transcriptional regulator n=1 Tax=Allorhizobium sonneratiae TaxID=2934936 RepID=UPI002034099E|nr:Crp/Fnr family transcriptional regulator [Allorhizobium sonneratiae]MCM2290799.1 Crp/Fnr family transcriptional regulator [Allorhizobium sonneratiae]
MSLGILKKYDKNDLVVSEGGQKRFIGFAITGLFVCRRCSPNGLVLALQNVRPGCVFNEMSLLDVSESSVEVAAAVDQSSALMFPVAVFRDLVAKYPILSSRLIEDMVARIGSLSELSFELATMKTDDRLRRTITKLALESDQLKDGGLICPAPTHAELASMLGTTREVVSRSITALCREGLIETSRQYILIRSAEALA